MDKFKKKEKEKRREKKEKRKKFNKKIIEKRKFMSLVLGFVQVFHSILLLVVVFSHIHFLIPHVI